MAENELTSARKRAYNTDLTGQRFSRWQVLARNDEELATARSCGNADVTAAPFVLLSAIA